MADDDSSPAADTPDEDDHLEEILAAAAAGLLPPSAEEVVRARARLARRLANLGVRPARATAHKLDILARSTEGFRLLLQRARSALEAGQRSHYFSVLSRTTQPAHVVAFVAVAVLAMLVFPRQPGAGADADVEQAADAAGGAHSPWTYLAYVVAFAAHFGSQFWMTFVSGLSLFFSLPRHRFAEVQKVLFPLYFAINAGLSLVTLAAFLRLQSGAGRAGRAAHWDAGLCVQVAGMVGCFLLELLVRLYLTPPLLKLITAKTEMEKTVDGVGQEVGRYNLGPLTQCPHYVKVHAAFRKVHTSIALANIAAMGCTVLHAHYLAHKICM